MTFNSLRLPPRAGTYRSQHCNLGEPGSDVSTWQMRQLTHRGQGLPRSHGRRVAGEPQTPALSAGPRCPLPLLPHQHFPRNRQQLSGPLCQAVPWHGCPLRFRSTCSEQGPQESEAVPLAGLEPPSPSGLPQHNILQQTGCASLFPVRLTEGTA